MMLSSIDLDHRRLLQMMTRANREWEKGTAFDTIGWAPDGKGMVRTRFKP